MKRSELAALGFPPADEELIQILIADSMLTSALDGRDDSRA